MLVKQGIRLVVSDMQLQPMEPLALLEGADGRRIDNRDDQYETPSDGDDSGNVMWFCYKKHICSMVRMCLLTPC